MPDNPTAMNPNNQPMKQHQSWAHTMTTAYPHAHSYLGDNDPEELIDTAIGKLPRWQAAAHLIGETNAAIQVRNDAIARTDAIKARHDARERELQARSDSIAERERAHAVNVTQFVDFVGKASVLFDRLHKLRADQAEEPLASPPGTESKSAEPEPSLELEDAEQPAHGDPPGDPVSLDQEVEFPMGELPAPPSVAHPIAVED